MHTSPPSMKHKIIWLFLMEYLRGFGCHFSGLRKLSLVEESIELLYQKLLSPGQIVPGGNAKGQLRVAEGVGDVRDDVLLIHTH